MAEHYRLLIDNYDISDYVNSFSIKVAKNQSANTRRTSSGTMSGTIVGTPKYSIEVGLVPNLPQTVISRVNSIVNSTTFFHKAKFRDVDGTIREKTVYFGDIDYDVKMFKNEKYIFNSISFSMIQK